MAEQLYQRIGGKVRGFGASSLWLGDGYVMEVAAMFGVETYRRWYLREIQAVLVRRTGKRAMWNLIWGIIGGLAATGAAGFTGLAAASAKERETQITFYVLAGIVGAFAAFCAVVVIWNSLLGPTCTISLQTPAGLGVLAAPGRRRGADAMLAKLRPLIEQAQSPNPHPQSA